jgi:Mor family transcriptional regulator
MTRVKDNRVKFGKANRNKEIRKCFSKRWGEDGIRWEIVMSEMILKYGLSESTIYQIVKRHGYYKDEETID